MLKQIEKARLFCEWGAVKIQYEDYRWVDGAMVFDNGRFHIKYEQRVKPFTRRKIPVTHIAAKFSMKLAVGNHAGSVNGWSADDYTHIPLQGDAQPSLSVLEDKAKELVATNFVKPAKSKPIRINYAPSDHAEVYWLYKDVFYKDTDDLTESEFLAVITSRQRARKARIKRAVSLASTPEAPLDGLRRGFIPEDVRLLVWQRDGGKCSKCGSRNELQFDHIIPFSLGGSSEPENLQILCGPCNRAKSNSVA